MKHPTDQWNTFFAIEKSIPYEAHIKDTKERSQACLASTIARRSAALSVGGLMRKQLRFLAWKIWLFQGMILAALCAVFFSLHDDRSLFWLITALPKFLCCSSGVIALSAVPILRRSARFRMSELEQSTRFSVTGLLTSQLLFIGVGDLGMLAVLALAVIRYGLSGTVIFLSLIIPFMTAAVTSLMLWLRTTPPVFGRAVIPLCTLIVLLMNRILDRYRNTDYDIRIGFWLIYVVLCLCVLYHECRKMRSGEYTERKL